MAYNENSKLYEGYIYLINNIINDKKYIGQTTRTIDIRWTQHKSTSKTTPRDSILYRAIRKYGEENFTITELEKIETATYDELRDILNSKEQYYIKLYNTYKGYGYNSTSGGDNTTDFAKLEVDAYDLDGNYLRSFDSCTEADQHYNLWTGACSKCCRGIIKQTKQLTFRYKGEPFDKFDIYHYKRSKYIYQFDDFGVLLNKYPNLSIATASVNENGRYTAIKEAIKKHIKAYGYYWSDTEEFDVSKIVTRKTMATDQYNSHGVLLNTFDTLTEASIFICGDASKVGSISQNCSGKIAFTCGCIWRYHGDPYDKFELTEHQIKLLRRQEGCQV